MADGMCIGSEFASQIQQIAEFLFGGRVFAGDPLRLPVGGVQEARFKP